MAACKKNFFNILLLKIANLGITTTFSLSIKTLMKNIQLLEIKDQCRSNLNKYTVRAFSVIPAIDNPLILDAGCGTGVSSLALIGLCNGTVYAVDPDQSSLDRLREKITQLRLNDRITVVNKSILDAALFDFKFDIILAEGLLNVIGFEKGMKALAAYVKKDGYLIIHDEVKNDPDKRDYFKKNNLSIIHSFELDESVWLDEYFYCLKSKMETIGNGSLESEMDEINENIKHKENLKSIYYIVKSGE